MLGIKHAFVSEGTTYPLPAAVVMFSAGVAVLAFSSLAWAYPNPGTVTGNIDVADPTLCKDASGTYFLFCKCGHASERGYAHGSQRLHLVLRSARLPIARRGRFVGPFGPSAKSLPAL